MEYARAVGVEVTNMLMSVNKKVQELEPHIPAQHTFRGDSLQNFIHDHQDRLDTGGKGIYNQWIYCD